MDTMHSYWNLILLGKPKVESEEAFLVLEIWVFVGFIKASLTYSEPDSSSFLLLYKLPQSHKFNF